MLHCQVRELSRPPRAGRCRPPTSGGVARLTSFQVQVADLGAAARFYGHFIGLNLSGEPHRHDENEALAWRDFASADYMMLHLAQAEPGRHSTGAQIGITVEDVDAVHQRAAQCQASHLARTIFATPLNAAIPSRYSSGGVGNGHSCLSSIRRGLY